jgi:hypothetical protein
MTGLNLGRKIGYPDVIFLSRFKQKQELCLKMGHDHCSMCFEWNVHNPATVAMRHMQSGKRHWINSTIAQVFLDLPHQVPEARDASRLSLVTWAMATGGKDKNNLIRRFYFFKIDQMKASRLFILMLFCYPPYSRHFSLLSCILVPSYSITPSRSIDKVTGCGDRWSGIDHQQSKHFLFFFAFKGLAYLTPTNLYGGILSPRVPSHLGYRTTGS